MGKLILGLRVVDGNGSKFGLSKSIIRNLLKLANGLPASNILAIVLIATSQSEQRFGNRIAKTYVTKQNR